MGDHQETWCLTPSDELSEDEFPGSLVDLEKSLCQYSDQLEAFQKDIFDTLGNVKEAVTETQKYHTQQPSHVEETAGLGRSHGGTGELASSKIEEATEKDNGVSQTQIKNLSSELSPVTAGEIVVSPGIEQRGRSLEEDEREPLGEASELYLEHTHPMSAAESTGQETPGDENISASHNEGKERTENVPMSNGRVESCEVLVDDEKAGDLGDIQNILSEVALLKETQKELNRQNRQWEEFLKEEEARKKREEETAALQKELSERFLKEARRHLAALRIARAWRTYRSERIMRRSNAATKIQSILRGLKTRKTMKKITAQRSAMEALEAAMITCNRPKVAEAAKRLEKLGLASEANSRLEDFDKEASRCLQKLRGAAEHGRYSDFENARTKAWAYPHLHKDCEDATKSFDARKKEIRESLDAAVEGFPGAAFEVLRQQAEGVGITKGVLDEIAVALVERDQQCYEHLVAAAKSDPFDGATFEACVFRAERLGLKSEIKEARRVLDGRRADLSQKLERDVQTLKHAADIQRLLDEAHRFGLIAANQGERLLKKRQKASSDELLRAATSQSKFDYDRAMSNAVDLNVEECVLIEAARILAARVDACGKALKSAATAGSLLLMKDAGLEASKLELTQPLQEATAEFKRERVLTIDRITVLTRKFCEFLRSGSVQVRPGTDISDISGRFYVKDKGAKNTINELHSVLESAKAMGLDEIHKAIPIVLQVQNVIVESAGNVLVTSATNSCDWEGRLNLREWNEVHELPQATDLIAKRLPKGEASLPLSPVHLPQVLSGQWQQWRASLKRNSPQNATQATLPSLPRSRASATVSRRRPTGKQLTESIILNNSGGKALGEIQTLDLGLEGLGSVKNLAEYCPNLSNLYLNVNQLDTLEDIVECSHLETLCVWENHLTDTEGINCLQRLCSLSLNQNRISSLGSEMWALRFLTEISLANNNILAIDNRLRGCSALQRLDLSGNSISHIQGVCSCAHLTYLDISRNRIESLEGLEACQFLQTLAASQNSLATFPQLHLPLLQNLWLNLNQITRIDKLPFLPHLQQLFLQDNEIHESIHLDALPNLKTLDLSFNAINTITTLNFLVPLQHLASLNLSDNRVTLQEGYRESLLTILPRLRELDNTSVGEKEMKAAVRMAAFRSPMAVQAAVRKLRTGMALFPPSLSGCQLHSLRIAQKLTSREVDAHEIGLGKGPEQIAETWHHSTLRHLISTQNARQKSTSRSICCRWRASSSKGELGNRQDSCGILDQARQKLADLASDDLSGFQNIVIRSEVYAEQQQAIHNSARKIQTCWRGYIFRSKNKQRLHKRQSAATTIQDYFRKFKERREAKSPGDCMAAIDNEVCNKTSAAAIQIQATFRGFCVRKRLHAALKAAKLIDDDDFDYSGVAENELGTPWYLIEEVAHEPESAGKPCAREAAETTQSDKVPATVASYHNGGTVEMGRESMDRESTQESSQSVVPHHDDFKEKPGGLVLDAELRTKERVEARDQRKREKLETLMKEWGFKDMGTAEAYYKAQQKQKKQKQRKRRDQRLKDPQVRLQRLQEKVESSYVRQHQHRNPIKSQIRDRSQGKFDGEKHLDVVKKHPVLLNNLSRNDETRRGMGSGVVERQSPLDNIVQPTCRSEAGVHADGTESESSTISRATEGDLVYFRSEIPNMKLWRRFMEEKKKSGSRQPKMLLNNWAGKSVGIEKKVERGGVPDLGITGQHVNGREFGRQ